jgi:NTE family protein
MEKKKIGLTLSGGGARGYGHLGVIKALEEFNIKPEIISGTSAGAMVAAFYAGGYSIDNIIRIAKKTDFFAIKNIVFGRAGIFKMSSLETLIIEHIPGDSFESLKIPIYVCASDIVQNKPVYFSSGPLSKAIMASSCIPMVYEPVKFNNALYLDGGLLDNFPVQIIRDKCEFLIGSYVNNLSDKLEHLHMKDMMDRSFHMALSSAMTEKSSICDLYIAPNDMSRFGMFDTSRVEEMVEFTYSYTRAQLQKGSTSI